MPILIGVRPLRCLALVVLLAGLGCHAPTTSASQGVQVGVKLTPELERRVEIMVRAHTQVTSDSTLSIGKPAKSDIPGYDLITASFAVDGKLVQSSPFLLSTDGKTLAQFNTYDISRDPAEAISTEGRPARGGPVSAPVLIVVFDDLECPYCASMNAEIFPAILNRYKDRVRVVYRDFPLEEIHPWAKHAAVDANCLAALSTPGYWNFVDFVHAHAADMSGAEKTTDKANQNLDQAALEEGQRQNVNQSKLAACVRKQDARAVTKSEEQAQADPLDLNSVPTLFINGEKVDGVVPIETLYHIIDRALITAQR